MSDEKKLKDLIRRVVAMTPDPPPFPEEEVPMARQETSKNRRPMLVFAGAAVLVIALSVPLLLFFRGSSPEVVATTAVVPATSTTTPESTTTTTRSTTTTRRVTFTWSGTVFLTQDPESSFLGNPALIPLSIHLPDPTGMLGSAANFTDVLPLIDVVPSGFRNAIPTDVRVLSSSLPEGGVVEVEMNEAFLDGAGGLLADFTMLNQLIYNLTSAPQMDNSDSVLFLVDGEPVTRFGTEGLDLSDPVNRQTFIDNLAPIFLASPITEAEHVYIVDGLANTFEATVNVRVIDTTSGEVTHEEYTTATCGTGCWGGFGVGIATDLVTPGKSAIQLLTYSPEDGSEQDVITIPIPENNEWIAVIGE